MRGGGGGGRDEGGGIDRWVGGGGGVERLEIEIYDIENDGDGARSRSALPSLVAVNLAMRADQTKIGC